LIKKYKLILVAGARPNFMKIAPLMHALENHSTIEPVLVHTGQHYDENMSDLFFRHLDIPEPDINLSVDSASHAVQTARIMERFEKVCIDILPDMVMVVGDVNSTVACTLVASKLNVKTAHYEAGLRSNDRSMPEEINRIVTDAICEYFFTTSKDANENLIKEGKPKSNIFLVGNLMIDTLVRLLPKAGEDGGQRSDVRGPEDGRQKSAAYTKLRRGKEVGGQDRYALVTLHRPSNVDDSEMLVSIMRTLQRLSEKLTVIFPVHPRTRLRMSEVRCQISEKERLYLIDPVGYLEFLSLQKNAAVVITDSGGIQEETTFLGIPCLTVRDNTERPITVWEGTNKLIGINEIEYEVEEILRGNGKKGKTPHLWDGNAADRIVGVLERILPSASQ